MSEHKYTHYNVCVGGAYNGQRVDVSGEYFRVREQKSFQIGSAESLGVGKPPQPTETKYQTYVKQSFKTAQSTISYWVPEGQSPEESLNLLLSNYHEK